MKAGTSKSAARRPASSSLLTGLQPEAEEPEVQPGQRGSVGQQGLVSPGPLPLPFFFCMGNLLEMGSPFAPTRKNGHIFFAPPLSPAIYYCAFQSLCMDPSDGSWIWAAGLIAGPYSRQLGINHSYLQFCR